MPTQSAHHALAMRIAAAGKSDLGIPRSVGRDFVAADKRAGLEGKRSAGIKRLAKRLAKRKRR